MNIVMVSPGWPPEHFANGIVSSVSQFYKAYTELGHSPQIITRNFEGEVHGENIHQCIEKSDLWMRFKNNIRWRLGLSYNVMSPFVDALKNKILELYDQGKADLIEIEETWGNAINLSGSIPIPIVVRLHGPWFLNGKANGMDFADIHYKYRIKLEGKGISAADGISAPSKSVLSETKKYYKRLLHNAEVIPNPVKAVSESERWSKAECDRNLLLFVGRFDRHKGGDLVLKAFNRIAGSHPKARLLFCGTDRGFLDSDGKRYSFNEYIEKLNLSSDIVDRIEFLGRQDASKIAMFRRKAAVTIIASRYENFGNVLLEAFALGCPVVATNCGGVPEIITHETTGLLAENENPDSLADEVSRLLEDHDYAASLGYNAWNDCRKRFDPLIVAERTLGFYKKVLKRFHNKKIHSGKRYK
jgi:glycosyltransferase involved in cell wall biosynthesis